MFVLACAGPGQPTSSQPSGGPGASGQPAAPRTLNVGVPTELPGLAPKIDTGVSDDFTKRLFNATLAFTQGDGSSHPYLAEGLPQLNSESWLVSADGTMETTYHLRPNLTWHDGQPLVADDFVFAFQVYTTPEFGVSDSGGFRSIESVAAPDPSTVLIRWKETFTDAGQVYNQLPPLPKHLLEQPFQ